MTTYDAENKTYTVDGILVSDQRGYRDLSPWLVHHPDGIHVTGCMTKTEAFGEARRLKRVNRPAPQVTPRVVEPTPAPFKRGDIVVAKAEGTIALSTPQRVISVAPSAVFCSGWGVRVLTKLGKQTVDSGMLEHHFNAVAR